MRHKLMKILLFIVGIQVLGSVVGLLISRRLSRGDEQSDEFAVAAFLGGKKFTSTAANLRSGSAVTSMGGIDLDLRGATLDPAGAHLDLRATMGGIQVTVPETWLVEVDEEVVAGELEVSVTPAEDLPKDAPKLHVHAVARFAGEVVKAKAA